MKKVKNTIPVYDIDALSGKNQMQNSIMAEPFASYLHIHPNLHVAHRHDFYHVLLFTKGSGSHTIDFEQFDVREGQIYFMIPGQVHSWNFTGEVDGFIINFHQSLLQSFFYDQQYLNHFSFFRGIARDSVINLQPDTYTTARELFEEIIEEVKNTSPMHVDMICSKLATMFISIQRGQTNMAEHAPGQSLLLLSNFRKLVEQYYQDKRLPKEYAAMLYVTPNHLNALCKNLLGMPAGEIIRDRVLLEAKRMLVNADLHITDISNRLNFTDNSYFTKFFKKYTGVTPEQFRKASFHQTKTQ